MKLLFALFIINLGQSLLVPGKKNDPQKRKLGLLDWFDSEEEKQENISNTSSEASTQKIMELIKMADSFKTDPHFKVALNISYKNLEPNELQ